MEKVTKQVHDLESLIQSIEEEEKDFEKACAENGNALDGLRRSLTLLRQRDRKREQKKP